MRAAVAAASYPQRIWLGPPDEEVTVGTAVAGVSTRSSTANDKGGVALATAVEVLPTTLVSRGFAMTPGEPAMENVNGTAKVASKPNNRLCITRSFKPSKGITKTESCTGLDQLRRNVPSPPWTGDHLLSSRG
jgi:hypothetical protein